MQYVGRAAVNARSLGSCRESPLLRRDGNLALARGKVVRGVRGFCVSGVLAFILLKVFRDPKSANCDVWLFP